MSQSSVKPKFFNLPTIWGSLTRVQAGLLDEEAEYAFTHGQCLALAVCYIKSLTLSEQQTHKIRLLLETYAPDKPPGLAHAYIRDAEGNAIDIAGSLNEKEYLNRWMKDTPEKFIVLDVALEDALNYETSTISIYTHGMYKQRFAAAKYFIQPLKDKIFSS